MQRTIEKYIMIIFIIVCPYFIIHFKYFYDIYLSFPNLFIVPIFVLAIGYMVKNYGKDNIININIIVIISIVPIILMPYWTDFYNYGKINYIYILSLSLAIVVLFNKKRTMEWNKFHFVILAYLFLLILSTAFSMDFRTSIIGTFNRNLGFSAIMCFLLTLITTMDGYKFSQKHLNYLVLSGTVIALYGIIQFYGFDPLSNEKCRAYSTIGNANILGTYVTLILPIVLFLYLHLKKTYYLISSIIIYWCMLCTYTRSAYLAFPFYLAFIIYYLYRDKSYKKQIKVLLIVLILFTVGFNVTADNSLLIRYLSIGKDFNRIVKGEDLGFGGSNRIFIWEKTLILIPERPFLGTGPDNYARAFMPKFKEELELYFGPKAYLDKAHNEYLQIVVTEGLPALCCYIIFMIMTLRRGIKNIKNNIYLIPFCASIIGYLVQMFFCFNCVAFGCIFSYILGCVINLSDNKNINEALH